jgi:DNA modification methylase
MKNYEQISWSTKTVSISNIIPATYNPRRWPDKETAELSKSLERFNLADPLIINKNNTIIGGHFRFKILKDRGIKNVDVRVPSRQLTEQEEKELNLRLNKNLGEWDLDLLADFGEDLLKDVGFDSKELDKIFQLESRPEDDDIPENAPPIAQKGDIWQLGRHRVMCGDSTKREDVERLMDGKKADIVFTDPPYKLQTDGGTNQIVGKAATGLGKTIEFISNFEPADFLNVLPIFFQKNMNAYVFCNKELLPDYLVWARDAGYSFNVLVWKKPNAIPIGDSHRPDIEYLLLFRKNAIWNNGLSASVNYSRLIESPRETGLHPTMKPIGIITNQLLISSHEKSLVVDGFLGSGSTLIASEKTGRICYGMELDQKYIDVIVQRYVDYTGNTNIIKNGEPIVWQTQSSQTK